MPLYLQIEKEDQPDLQYGIRAGVSCRKDEESIEVTFDDPVIEAWATAIYDMTSGADGVTELIAELVQQAFDAGYNFGDKAGQKAIRTIHASLPYDGRFE